jgi:tRNA uridine 5-carbamoylmethylation protein Kti12
MMHVNIENCINQVSVHAKPSHLKGQKYIIKEFIEDLKRLRKRSDEKALEEFFDLYHFNGDC